jgi:hypothetical protein
MSVLTPKADINGFREVATKGNGYLGDDPVRRRPLIECAGVGVQITGLGPVRSTHARSSTWRFLFFLFFYIPKLRRSQSQSLGH